MAQKVERYINPLLAALKDLGGSARPGEVYTKIAIDLGLSDSVRDAARKDGRAVFKNEIAWAKQYLVETGYIDKSRRGVWTLTEKGRSSTSLSNKALREVLHEGQRLLRSRSSVKEESPDLVDECDSREGAEDEADTEDAYQRHLLELMGSLPPAGFERLCQRLLREVGFEEVNVTGRSGDGGIDGIGVFKVNHFVTFKVLFQCKRYKGNVGAPHVRDFRGAMQGRADKGMILTTGSFSADARREAVRDGVPPIELVDGDELIGIFEELELGLKPRTTYDVDLEFFKEFRE